MEIILKNVGCLGTIKTLPDRLVVGHRFLAPVTGVRIPVGQQKSPGDPGDGVSFQALRILFSKYFFEYINFFLTSRVTLCMRCLNFSACFLDIKRGLTLPSAVSFCLIFFMVLTFSLVYIKVREKSLVFHKICILSQQKPPYGRVRGFFFLFFFWLFWIIFVTVLLSLRMLVSFLCFWDRSFPAAYRDLLRLLGLCGMVLCFLNLTIIRAILKEN